MEKRAQGSIRLLPEQLHSLRACLLDKGARLLATRSESEAFRLRLEASLIIGYKTGSVVYHKGFENLLEGCLKKIMEPSTELLLGSDEAGKGEWLGPLVVAAVALDREGERALVMSGLRDSKLLTMDDIRRLSSLVRKKAVAYRTHTIMPRKFNELWSYMKKRGKGLNQILEEAHMLAIRGVLNSINSRVRVYVDDFGASRLKKRLLKGSRAWLITSFQQEPRGERHAWVAAASILARAVRESKIDFMESRLGIRLRGLSQDEARAMGIAHEIAKEGYLK